MKKFLAISEDKVGRKVHSPKGRLIKGAGENMPLCQMKIERADVIEEKNTIDWLMRRGRAGVWIRRHIAKLGPPFRRILGRKPIHFSRSNWAKPKSCGVASGMSAITRTFSFLAETSREICSSRLTSLIRGLRKDSRRDSFGKKIVGANQLIGTGERYLCQADDRWQRTEDKHNGESVLALSCADA